MIVVMRLAPKKKVFLRGEVPIPQYSQLGRLQVGKPRLASEIDRRGRTLHPRSPISRTLRTFLSKPLPHPGGGAVKGLVEVYSWGEGGSGQLGHGETVSKKIPGKIQTLAGKGILFTHNATPISCGLMHAGVVNSFGEAFTWGSNFFFQVGHEHSGGGVVMALDEREPSPGSLKTYLPKGFTARSIACGGWHNLLLGDLHTKKGLQRAVFVWGNGGQGQLGLVERDPFMKPPPLKSSRKKKDEDEDEDEESPKRTPVANARHPTELKPLTRGIKDPSRIVMVAAGPTHSVALTDEGEVYWWGEKRYVTEPEKLDLLTTDPLRFKSVACGAFHTLGLTENGEVYSWGAGQVNPELPVHSSLDPHFVSAVDSVAPPSRYRFTQIDIQNVASIQAANDASLAITRDGELYFWKGTPTTKPKQLLKGMKIVDCSISWTHAAAVTEKGALYMWRIDEKELTPDINLAYKAQWEDPDSRDFIQGTVPLPPFRGGRKGHTPHVGSLVTPMQLTYDPCSSSTPFKVNKSGPLSRRAVVGIRLGWNYAIATAVIRRVGPAAKRVLLPQLVKHLELKQKEREEKKERNESENEKKALKGKKGKQVTESKEESEEHNESENENLDELSEEKPKL